jgi:ribosomal protein L22
MINPIRGMKLSDALLSVQTMQKGETKKLYDLLRSAATNAKLTEADYALYKVGEIVAEEAQRLYRVVPRARGSAFRIRRRYSRVKVNLLPLKTI